MIIMITTIHFLLFLIILLTYFKDFLTIIYCSSIIILCDSVPSGTNLILVVCHILLTPLMLLLSKKASNLQKMK